jgi:hypothetical protein
LRRREFDPPTLSRQGREKFQHQKKLQKSKFWKFCKFCPAFFPGRGAKNYNIRKNYKNLNSANFANFARIHSRAENNIRARPRKLIVAVF